MITQKITAEEFYTAFLQEWEELTSQEDITGSTPWEEKVVWTKKMLSHNGFFNRVMKRLVREDRNLEYHTEWYFVDALYIGGKGLFGGGLSYPSAIYALIEHEFGEDLEKEMWKLVHWRSPLKVIVNYDWSDSEKTTDKRKNYVANKVAELRDMKREVNAFHGESSDTQYMLIMAQRLMTDSEIIWQRIDL